jgi:23S rRNA (uracil1939-C5)-methyltransferase
MTDSESHRHQLTIARLGAQGDGVAEAGGGQVFVPYTLPGERVTIEPEGAGRARLVAIEAASPDRVPPVCRHFGRCGGCAVQHVAPSLYRAWKRASVAAAFSARGLEANIGDLIEPNGLRRRATFSARRTSAGTMLGYHEAASHELVDLAECPVLEPAIVSALPALRALVAPLMPRKGEARVNVTMTNGGLDVAIADVERELTAELRTYLASLAERARIARLSIGRDPLFASLAPELTFGTVDVQPPPGAFIQAVAAAEDAMAGVMLAAAGKSKSVADLFCGIGAFTFRLAGRAKVFAADSEPEAVEAIAKAVKTARGLKPITVIRRDLFREPLSPLELKDFDAVVFDPPRAGAEAQARMIARSKVKTVVAISCNPATLARDARILVDGGYAIESVTPIDQFRYSAHVEAVAVFRR